MVRKGALATELVYTARSNLPVLDGFFAAFFSSIEQGIVQTFEMIMQFSITAFAGLVNELIIKI